MPTESQRQIADFAEFLRQKYQSPQAATPPEIDDEMFIGLRGHPPLNNRIYFICCVLAHFSKIVNTKTTWPQQLVDVMDSFPSIPYAVIGDMGFPANWKTHEFWK